MERVTCNLCGSSAQHLVYSRPDGQDLNGPWYDVVECDDCGLGFVNPRPTSAEIGDYYPPDYYDWLANADHEPRFRAESRYLADVETPGRRPLLLDVGCGVGGFARYMAAHGWDVQGVEPYCPVPVDDFPVHRTMLDSLDGLDDRFDAVTAWAVFEHLHDPMTCFRKVGALLRPGGRFVFLVTNFDSLSSRRLFMEDVPRHLYFFTRETVAAYLDAGGMELTASHVDDDVYTLGSRGALNYLFCRYVKRRAYGWTDYPMGFPDYLARHGLKRGPMSIARFVCSHPVTALDRLAEPLVARWQKLSGSYGVVTYVAHRRAG